MVKQRHSSSQSKDSSKDSADIQPDVQRIYYLYRYLLGCLAMERRPSQAYNAAKTAERVGDKDLRKLFPALFDTERAPEGDFEKDADKNSQAGTEKDTQKDTQKAWREAAKKYSKARKITTGYVVSLLTTLNKSLKSAYKESTEPYSRVLTTEDILIALYQLIELTPDEREQLDLPVGDSLTLLKQILLTLRTNGGINNYEMIFKTYKESVGLNFSGKGAIIQSLGQVDELIEETVKEALAYLPERQNRYSKNRELMPGKDDTIQTLSRKAQREIRRLLALSGNTQSSFPTSDAEHPYIRQYLQAAFVKKLAKTVVSNERLTDQFPVYIKRLTMEACGPLPFADEDLGTFKAGGYYPPLLSKDLQEMGSRTQLESTGDLPGPSDYELASQEAAKITVEFYIKVPKNYQSAVEETFEILASSRVDKDCAYRRVDFFFSSTGVGGSLSHAIKVINSTLLFDIPCLDRFFPIAHDVTSTQAIIKDNVPSPISAHSLVKLCHKESVGRALRDFQNVDSSYDTFSFGDPIGHGDFCGFDLFLAQVKSALQARLQAIRNTGVNSDTYIEQLCQKTERLVTLATAWQRLKSYPFSSMAMIGTIHQKIISKTFKKGDLKKDTPAIYFNAYLSIAEVLLDEGAYRASYYGYLRRLNVLDGYVRNGLVTENDSSDVDSGQWTVFSSTLIVRYLLCLASYYYLYDLGDSNREQLLPDDFPARVSREYLVNKAWETLNLAQQHVEVRLKKYIVIGEVSQGIFNPHYELLGRIYLMRSKLLTFFPRLVPEDRVVLPTEHFAGQQRKEASIHWGRLYLIEKARLYTAANGNSEVYAYYAAIQSCLYLVAAYEQPPNLVLNDLTVKRTRSLNPQQCLEWAEKLRDHALLTYADTGRQCYYAIKEKSGLPGQFDKYGHYSIEKIPAIFESRNFDHQEISREVGKFLVLDMSLLAINIKDLPKLTANHPTKNIYLFGTNACHLFFVRGLYLLCSNTTEEFAKHEPSTGIQWETKLVKAMRLMDLAWAIAEDGCGIKKEKNSRQRTITRPFGGSRGSGDNGTSEGYTSAEINSVRDLYPRRVSEIADLGKLFSATCMVLRLHTVPASARPTIIQDIDKLLNMLHSESKLQQQRTLRALLFKQTRYNGHLQDYLLRASTLLKAEVASFDQALTNDALADYRNQLVRSLFLALLA